MKYLPAVYLHLPVLYCNSYKKRDLIHAFKLCKEFFSDEFLWFWKLTVITIHEANLKGEIHESITVIENHGNQMDEDTDHTGALYLNYAVSICSCTCCG